MLLFTLFWLLLFGGAVGSFLNVVIYRLPAGLSLSFPASHCPKCGHAIRPRDNVPVFGWILLQGKCRDCRASISVRYPLIEGFCAILFANIGYVVLVNRSFDEMEQSLGLVVYYLLLLMTLLAAGMMDYDGKKVPVHLFVPAFFGGLIALAVSWDKAVLDFPPLLAGTVLILLFLPQNRIPWFIGVMIVGLCLGWQLALIISGFSLIYFSVSCCFRFRIFPMFPLFLIAWGAIAGSLFLR